MTKKTGNANSFEQSTLVQTVSTKGVAPSVPLSVLGVGGKTTDHEVQAVDAGVEDFGYSVTDSGEGGGEMLMSPKNVNLAKHSAPGGDDGVRDIADVGSLQLEFRALANYFNTKEGAEGGSNHTMMGRLK